MADNTTEAHLKFLRKKTVIFLTPDPEDAQNFNYAHKFLTERSLWFHELGADVRSIPWSTSPPSNHDASSIYVVNLLWGYHHHSDRWYTWLHSWPTTIRLVNPVSLLLWNSRKTYLKDLEAAGIPIIPTRFVDQVDASILIETSRHFQTDDLIVKPQFSASSYNTLRVLVGRNDFDSAPKSMSIEDALLKLQQSNCTMSMMIQPFMKNVNSEGEISVLVFGGKVSHAVRKIARADDFRVQEGFGGQYSRIENPSVEIMDLAQATIAACLELPTYARVDMVRNNLTDVLSIGELELIEPGLFLDYESTAGINFARAILNENQ